jgi:glycosyltransferase involved in cell wall biosynthesis
MEAIIVIPCYNEERRLDVATFLEYGRRAGSEQLLFVNDGSQDRTSEVLRGLVQSRPDRFDVLDFAVNRGKAEVVRQGMLAAIERRPKYVGFWDADLATSLDEIAPMLQVLRRRTDIHMVVGTRLKLLGHHIQRNRLRALCGRGFANLASWTLGLKIFDTQCGAKVFRVTPELTDILSEPYLTRWIFDVEMLARMTLLRRDGFSKPVAECVFEYPLDAWRDVAGSNVKAADFSKAFGELVNIYWRYLRPGARWAPAAPSQPITIPLAGKKAA